MKNISTWAVMCLFTYGICNGWGEGNHLTADRQKEGAPVRTNTSERSGHLVSESPAQGRAGGLSSFLFHGQQKGTVRAEPREEAVKEESHQMTA